MCPKVEEDVRPRHEKETRNLKAVPLAVSPSERYTKSDAIRNALRQVLYAVVRMAGHQGSSTRRFSVGGDFYSFLA